MNDEIFIDNIDLNARILSTLKDNISLVNEFIITCSTPIVGKLKSYNRGIVKIIKIAGAGTFVCTITMTKNRLTPFKLSYIISNSDFDPSQFIKLNSKYTDISDLKNDLSYIIEVLEAAIESAE